jgi:hypothetical protein
MVAICWLATFAEESDVAQTVIALRIAVNYTVESSLLRKIIMRTHRTSIPSLIFQKC